MTSLVGTYKNMNMNTYRAYTARVRLKSPFSPATNLCFMLQSPLDTKYRTGPKIEIPRPLFIGTLRSSRSTALLISVRNTTTSFYPISTYPWTIWNITGQI
uniref:Uncharacterized protein n=1 Tax=Cacopsylla melanoneura TaxID=428564 RepID=A0A8D9B0G5_9HEMI